MAAAPFTPQFKTEPYWWEAAPLRDDAARLARPATCDVAIIGSGYTGLAAALVLARAGRHVLVLDAGVPGTGCSTRNGGQVGPSLKPTLASLAPRLGEPAARALIAEGRTAFEWLASFVREEQIDCHWQRVGLFDGAHNARAFALMVREAAADDSEESYAVAASEQSREIGTDFYRGGIVYPERAALHPAKLHAQMRVRAEAAGATVIGHCPVQTIDHDPSGHRLRIPGGSVRARQVLVATNGYTGRATPWLQRRVIPIGSYMIATEPLPESLAAAVLPTRRLITDSRRLVVYYRLCEGGRRMLFGGRVSAFESDHRRTAPALYAGMCQIFPQLQGVRITHSWGGNVAFTFDSLPHLGADGDGVHYCLGYCGSGISLSTYFGTRIAQQMLGRTEGRTALDGLAFPGRPYYRGVPWFLPAAIQYYRWRDRLGR